MRPKRVAIVAEWLTSRGGAEKVVSCLLEIYPEADLFTTVYNRDKLPEFASRHPKTSFLQSFPLLNKRHQLLAPLLPLGISSLNLSGYDLIISSSSSVGKGIKKPKGSVHICYCHTPMRYAWEPDVDDRIIKLPFGKLFVRYLKSWDKMANKGVDYFLCNSKYTLERIKKFYKREATVVYPPVNIDDYQFTPGIAREDYFCAISRLVNYKRIDLAIEACRKLDRRLIVIGDGPQMESLKKIASDKTTFLGRASDSKKFEVLRRAKALIFPADEDFGIVPIEAMSQGTPVIAYGNGGVRESVKEPSCGIFFPSQSADSVCEAIEKFEKLSFNEREIIDVATGFSQKVFKEKILKFIDLI
jgi:glycosyltransferase involved in cell wall biosynthesis